MASKKRKVDNENRQFKSEWTDNFCFYLPGHDNAKPTCLLCTQTVAVCKVTNIQRHFETKHGTFNNNFPPKSAVRKTKIESLIASYKKSVLTIHKTSTAQESAMAASLRVAWHIAKSKRPFTESELMKECAIEMLQEVLDHDDKTKKAVTDLVKQIPLSNTSTTRRVEVLGDDCFKSLLEHLKIVDHMSLAIDESCDNTDIAQLSVFVRFFDGQSFREELLCLIHLDGQTTGEIVFEELTSFFAKNDLDLKKVNCVVTDGAPSMLGSQRGLVSRLAAVNPAITSIHCIIHQSVLCSKLSGEMQESMTAVMRLVNFIRENSSLQHRLFRAILEDMNAAHQDLLIHNDIRWLSKGKVLERVCDLLGEIRVYLGTQKSTKARDFLEFINSNTAMAKVFFLSDITSHLNNLNLQLQGRDHTVADLHETVSAFRSQLLLFDNDLRRRMLHFPRLRQHCEQTSSEAGADMKAFMSKLIENFSARFENFKFSSDLLLFIRRPFSISPDGEWTAEAKALLPSLDEGALQLEMVKLSTSEVLKAQHRDATVCEFWSNIVSETNFKNIKKLAMFFLAMFGSTYTCESGFSTMNLIKSQQRNRITNEHLHQCLRLATTSYQPNFRKLAFERRCHFSH